MPQLVMLISFFILFAAIFEFAANFKRLMDEPTWDFGGYAAVHMLSAFFVVIGFLGLIGGFVWFLIDKYAG